MSRRAGTVCLSALLLILASCDKKSDAPPPAPPPPEVGVVTVEPEKVPVTTDLPGRVNPLLQAEVRARVDGIVLKRYFVEGSDVKAGQILFLIDPAPFQAALDQAKATQQKDEANLVALRAQAERFRVLVAANAVSKQDYVNAVSSQLQAVASIAADKAAVETAQINLNYTQVRSPITGRIGISQVTVGAYVQASAATLMATVQQFDPIYVDVTQSTTDLLQLRRDAAEGRIQMNGPDQVKTSLILEDGSQYPLPGTFKFSDITVDESTGSVTVRSVYPNPNFELLPGMFVRTRIVEGINDKALLVPEVGVTHDAKGEPTALVVGDDNKVQLRVLNAPNTYGTNWVVNGGLKAGDRVIVQGVQKVQPGMTVKPVAAQLTQAADSSAPAAQ
jgi:membrane fusion protein (multidrug efflux system)